MEKGSHAHLHADISGAEARGAAGVESKRHRYPFSLVWTPIHPLSWIMPYVGHVGLADAAGRVIDFAGPFYVSFDNMMFGWPTRYYVLEEQRECGADSWDPTIYEIAAQYAACRIRLLQVELPPWLPRRSTELITRVSASADASVAGPS